MIFKVRSFLRRSFPVLMLVALLLSGRAPSKIMAAGGPVIDEFRVNPSDDISTNSNPFLWAHATDPTVDISSCQYQYMIDVSPWSGWISVDYYADRQTDGTPVFGAGVCMSPTLNLAPNATTFSGQIRFINSLGVNVDSAISTLAINNVVPNITVQPVTTFYNPLPIIYGTVDAPNALISVEIHNADYSLQTFYNGINNGDGTWNVTISDMFAEGTYIIDVTATNSVSSGYASSQFIVVAAPIDTISPIIILGGANPQTINVFSNYSELGATALDNIDGDISLQVIIDSSAVNDNIIGSYAVTYDVSDIAGNTAHAERTVNVVDTQKPTISLLGSSEITLDQFSTYSDSGATAWDNYDGNITSKLVATGSVSTSVPGNYIIRYNVADSSNNSASEVIRIVHIIGKADTMAPTIISIDPTDGSKYVQYNQTIRIKFSEPIDPTSANKSNISLKMGRTSVPFTISVESDTILVKPIGNLKKGETYTLSVEKIKDKAGNILAYPYLGKFKTASYIPGKKSVDDWVRFSPRMMPYLPQTLGSIGGNKSVIISSIGDALALFASKKNNSITSLYKELLAAKLNMGAGYSSWAISRTVRNVDSFLSHNNENDWDKMPKWQKDQVKDWLKMLKEFND